MKMIFTLRMTLFALLISFAGSLLAQNTSLPYFNGFENPQDTAGWTMKKRSQASGFWFGEAVHCLGRKSLYISPDSGTTATYGTTTSGYVSVAYKSFTLAAGTYTLAFDYQCGGNGTSQDMKVAFVPSSVNITSSAAGSSYPSAININQFTDDDGNNVFSKSAWRHVTGSIVVNTAGTYNLCFAFRCNGSSVTAPGACIDNIQLDIEKADTSCTRIPYNITVTKDSQTGVIVSWEGNASEYEVIAAPSSDPANFSFCRHTGITTTADTMLYSELTMGHYFFYVRAICGSDTSMYGEISDIIIYDVSATCLDFVTFNAPGVQCTYGTYTNPYATIGYIDNGPTEMSSRHTVHTDLHETDARTGGQLHTVPAGDIMSVRLGNWDSNAEAESITYTYTPSGTSPILILKYAVIFEEPGHDQAPEFLLEVMNVNNVLLDAVCTNFNFRCDGTLTNGWHQYTGGGTNMWWKEWSTIGVNLLQYVGQTVKIRLTTKDCNWSGHCGYAYFTLGCEGAELDGGSCGGEQPTSLRAPSGFTYQWINNTTGQTVSTSQTLPIVSTDTATYTCVCTNIERTSCYFTLSAYTQSRFPEARFHHYNTSRNCMTEVHCNNTSSVYTYNNGVKTYLPNESIVAQTWTVRTNHTDRPYSNMTSSGSGLTINVPADGDTLTVTLTAWKGKCDDDTTITIYVPAIGGGVNRTIVNSHTCLGEPVFHNGSQYTFTSRNSVQVVNSIGDTLSLTGQQPIRVIDTLTSSIGCDSIVELHLTAVVTDTFRIDTVIPSYGAYCMTVYDPDGNVLVDTCFTEEYRGAIFVPSAFLSCDSLVYFINITMTYDSFLISSDCVNGYVLGVGVYAPGDTVTLEAVADPHYNFIAWTDGCDTAIRTIIVTGNAVYTPLFVIDAFTVTAISDNDKMGKAYGGGIYGYGDTAVLSVASYVGYYFTGWDNGDTKDTLYVVVVSDTTFIAYFDSVPVPVDDVSSPQVIAYASQRNIVVSGAEGQSVKLYDLTGRLLTQTLFADEPYTFTVSAAGVYFVRVNDRKTFRVIVQ